MRAGTLRKRALFEARTDGAAGSQGERLPSWAPVSGGSAIPCSLTPQRGDERQAAGGLIADQGMVLTCRSNPVTDAITASGHRVTVDSVVYNIRSNVNPDQRGKMRRMVVEEGPAE